MKFQKTLIASALMAAGLGLATSTYAVEKGDWLMRVGATSINPDDSSSGTLPDNLIGVDSDTQLSISFTYMYSDNVGVEILASLPFTHDITTAGTKVGEVEHLPPTVSLEYHFNPKADVRPYVSAGLNWTTILDESLDDGTPISVDDSTGLALTAGVDMDINKDWFFNASIRYMDIDTTADIANGAESVDIEIDPWVYTLGVGTTF